MQSTLSVAVMASLLAVVAGSPRPNPVAVAEPNPSPTDIPSSNSAQNLLDGLTVATPGSTSGYSREKFPHWITQHDNCDTREVVLQRDGTGIVEGSNCTPTSGTWVSPYDDATWTASGDVDIDHMVPLENAWISGAANWTTDQRQDFANDLTRPQLWTVTDNVNESKGDRSPDEWKPPSQDFWCTYAESYIQVKSYYSLTVTSAEKDALADMLGSC